MIANEKKQSMMLIRALLRWMVLALLFASAHAFAQSTGTVTYVYTDPQGTPLAEADANGNVTATFEYTPYGTYAPSGTSNPGPTPNGPGYTGHVNDPETNLIYMQARYYDPSTGDFLSTDSVAPVAGNLFNFGRYNYASNNPIINIDPNGRDTVGEEIDQNGQAAAEAGNHVSTYGWAFAAVAWNVFGAESVSQVADKGSSSTISNEVNAGLEILGALPPIKIVGEVATVVEDSAKAAGITAKDGLKVTGLTKHGVDRAIGDGAKRAGTKPSAILDALKNPAKIKEGVDSQGRAFKVYTGGKARVVVNPETGKIISTNPLSREGTH